MPFNSAASPGYLWSPLEALCPQNSSTEDVIFAGTFEQGPSVPEASFRLIERECVVMSLNFVDMQYIFFISHKFNKINYEKYDSLPTPIHLLLQKLAAFKYFCFPLLSTFTLMPHLHVDSSWFYHLKRYLLTSHCVRESARVCLFCLLAAHLPHGHFPPHHPSRNDDLILVRSEL